MIETNHIWTTDKIYCQRLKAIVNLTQEHVSENCLTCRFFAGTAQGEGIENVYYDGSNEAILSNPNPWALRAKMSKVSDNEVEMAYQEGLKLQASFSPIDQEERNRRLME
jgi:hypothetical protein